MPKEKKTRAVTLARWLAAGVPRRSRSVTYHSKGKYLHAKKGANGKKQEKKPRKANKPREPRWYAAEDKREPLPSRKSHHKPTKLRDSITPGTVLILLAGRFRGKRVVFLKQLPSGLLLVTGPFKINGVPLRRVSQAYVIATSTKVDVSKVNLSGISDALFARERSKKPAGSFLNEPQKEKKEVSPARKEAQEKVDSALAPVVRGMKHLTSYLGARFTLSKGQFPHMMKF